MLDSFCGETIRKLYIMVMGALGNSYYIYMYMTVKVHVQVSSVLLTVKRQDGMYLSVVAILSA